MADSTGEQKYFDLVSAIHELRERGLYPAAKWASEQLVGLATDVVACCDTAPMPESSAPAARDPAVYLLAKSYFDVKEYRRCAHALREAHGTKALFLRCYALYLAGEKRKEEERIEKSGPLGRAVVANLELGGIETELQAAAELGHQDGFTLYLMGLVLSDMEKKREAVEALVASVTAFPCNWGAWQTLQVLCTDAEAVAALALPHHWMREFFLASLCLDLSHNAEALSRLQALSQAFQNSDFIVAQAGAVHYQLRNFDDAEMLFKDLLQRDPYRLDGMDIFSNVLFVKELFADLSSLAHSAALTDKYRPETCCIIGNYYSLKLEHVKAIDYFRRALKLSPTFLSAWTLMGHEFMEIKNPSAAIDAYRQAVDISPRDYRAWYGLGQAYEMMSMQHYALYYYKRATALRPNDSRMWCAMGQCYESDEVAADQAAIRCYNRALQHNDREGLALTRLAALYEKHEHLEEAAFYYSTNLQRIETEGGGPGEDAAKALAFLAAHHKDKGELAEAEAMALKLMDHGGQWKEGAKALLREIRNLLRHHNPAHHSFSSSSQGRML